jgi:outer membrane protein assembly factor BamB
MYAFNAQSGAVRWTHNSGGKISGSPTIVGNVIYFSSLGMKSTAGLDVRTGRQVFSFPDGAFNPVISDHGAIYLAGYTQLYQMLPQAKSHHTASAAHSSTSARSVRKNARK